VSDAAEPLREIDASDDPLEQFERWFAVARERSGLRDPNTMALATAAADGAPAVRMVLLKGHDDRGFVFFTNYGSRKGDELAENPHAALLFYWDPLGRQVRIEGPVMRATREETEAYAHARPRGSQLSALASPQSRPVSSREELEGTVTDLRERWTGVAELPVSESWGGFRLTPERYEFWQHRDDRLHDRLQYTRVGDGWERVRLAP
jgi:pyridoxamine 5'-phosphate oxidase